MIRLRVNFSNSKLEEFEVCSIDFKVYLTFLTIPVFSMFWEIRWFQIHIMIFPTDSKDLVASETFFQEYLPKLSLKVTWLKFSLSRSRLHFSQIKVFQKMYNPLSNFSNIALFFHHIVTDL